ncbi:hypothetical protein E4U25_002538 [Claviceps purpurea]|nr:hypothetical protein E4U25_002538 [Claviceps purpurea]
MSSQFSEASTTCPFAYFDIYRAKEDHMGIGCGRHSVVSKDALALPRRPSLYGLVAHRRPSCTGGTFFLDDHRSEKWNQEPDSKQYSKTWFKRFLLMGLAAIVKPRYR